MGINMKVLIVFLVINTAAFIRERVVKSHDPKTAVAAQVDSTRADSIHVGR